MGETNHWEAVSSIIEEASDIIRSAISFSGNYDNCNPVEPIHEFIEKEMKDIHRKTLPYISKLKKGDFLSIITAELNKYHERFIVDKHSATIQTSEMFFDAKMHSCIQKVAVHVSKRRGVEEHWLQLKWLKCFGITEKGLGSLGELHYLYECNDIADNAISRLLKCIHVDCAQDFHLIRVYFSKLQELNTTAEYTLEGGYARNQTAALRAKFFMHPWEDLPDHAEIFYYCSVCKRWNNPVVDRLNSKTAQNIYAIGVDNALYDIDESTLYCGKQSTSINVKKLMESGEYYRNDHLDNEKTARIIRKHKESGRCSDVPLVPVRMVGTVKKLGGKLWALCEVCANITQFEGMGFGPQGFTCGYHTDVVAERNMTLQSWRIQIKDVVMDEKCEYCGKGQRENKNMPLERIRVLNEECHYEWIYICDSDFEKCKRLFEDAYIIKKKDLISKILDMRTGWIGGPRRGRRRP